MTAGGPAVVIFEDLHWADSESIALFERIADLEGDRLLVGTYRPAEVMRRNPVAGLLDRLERRHSSTTSGWSDWPSPTTSAPHRDRRQAAAVLGRGRAARPAPAATPSSLKSFCAPTRTSRRWATSRRRGASPRPCAGRSSTSSPTSSGWWRRRPCSATACRSTSSPRSPAATSPISSGAARPRRAGCVRGDREDEFAFRHALVREAIGERLLGRERRRLHEAAHTALLGAGNADWALVAKHARGAGRYDDMLTAVHKGTTAYFRDRPAFQALEPRRDGAAEAPDDADLLAAAAQPPGSPACTTTPTSTAGTGRRRGGARPSG